MPVVFETPLEREFRKLGIPPPPKIESPPPKKEETKTTAPVTAPVTRTTTPRTITSTAHPPGLVIPGPADLKGVEETIVDKTITPPPRPEYTGQTGTGTIGELTGGQTPTPSGPVSTGPSHGYAPRQEPPPNQQAAINRDIDIKIARGYTPEAAIYGYNPPQTEDISNAPQSVQYLARKGWIITSERETKEPIFLTPQQRFYKQIGVPIPGTTTQTTYYAHRPTTQQTFDYVYGTGRADVLTGAAFSKTFMGLGTIGSGIQGWITGDKKVGESELQSLQEYALKTKEYGVRYGAGGGLVLSIGESPAVQETVLWAGMEVGAPVLIGGAGRAAELIGTRATGFTELGTKIGTKLTEFGDTLSPTGKTVLETIRGTGKTITEYVGQAKEPITQTGRAFGRAMGTKLGQTTIIADLYLVTEGPRLIQTARTHPERFGAEFTESAGLWGAMSTSLIGETKTPLTNLAKKDTEYIQKEVPLTDVKTRATGQTYTAGDLGLRVKMITDDNTAVISRDVFSHVKSGNAQDIIGINTPQVQGTGFSSQATLRNVGAKEGELLGTVDMKGVIIGTDKRAVIQFESGTQILLESNESIILGTGLITPVSTEERTVMRLISNRGSILGDKESNKLADILFGPREPINLSLDKQVIRKTTESSNKQVFDIFGYDITKKYDEDLFISKTASQTRMRGTGDFIESGSMSITKTGDVGMIEKEIFSTTKKPRLTFIGKGKDYGTFLSEETMTTAPDKYIFDIKELTEKKPGQIHDFLKDTRSQTYPPSLKFKTRPKNILKTTTDEGDFFIKNTLGLDRPTRMTSTTTHYKPKTMFNEFLGDEGSGGLPSLRKKPTVNRILEPSRRDLIFSIDASKTGEDITVGLQKAESYSPLKDLGTKEEKDFDINVINRGRNKGETNYLLKGRTETVPPETQTTDILTGTKVKINIPKETEGATILTHEEYKPLFDTSYRTINIPIRKLEQMETGTQQSSRYWTGQKPQGPIFTTTTKSRGIFDTKTTTIQDIITDKNNKDDYDHDVIPVTIFDFKTDLINDNKNDVVPITIQDVFTGQRNDQRQRQDFLQRTDTTTDLIRTPRTITPHEPTPIRPPPTIPFIPGLPGNEPSEDKNKKTNGRTLTGFVPEVHEKGRWIRLTNKTLTQREATNLLANALDETKATVGRLRPSKGTLTNLGIGLKDYNQMSYKFKTKGDLLIEKREYRIDTQGEHEQITVKGWLANKQKGKRQQNMLTVRRKPMLSKEDLITKPTIKRTNKKRSVRYV